ncbi:MAG TPA: 4-hydroxy-tetrahydrodipicolinate synthase, partial [Pseudoalteromonas sp.]|nr:4-hydroxy-tetrahydrodipicolinate synthase [Pseudoalteromonas sp.]
MINNFNLNDYSLWTALVTPFDQHGDVDYNTLTKLVSEQEAA